MTFREIFDMEQDNLDKIILLKQGNFYHAYEHSAYFFYHQVKSFRLIRKSPVVLRGETLVYLGFQAGSLPDLMGSWECLFCSDTRVEYRAKGSVGVQDYIQWKEAVPLFKVKPQPTSPPAPVPTLFLEDQPGYAGPTHEAFERSRRTNKSPYNHEHLPVFRAYIGLNETFDRDKSLDSVPRSFRYALVDKLREDMIQVEVFIYMLHDSDDLDEKLSLFRQARMCCLDMRGRFRSLYRKGLLNETRFIGYANLLDEVAEQFKKWQSATRQRKERNSP